MKRNRVDGFSTSSPPWAEEPQPQPRRREAGLGAPAIFRARGTFPSSSGRLTAGRPLPVEIAFLASHGVPSVVLHYAAALAHRQGASADAVLIGEGLVGEETFYRALAAHLGAFYLDESADLAPGGDLAADAERGLARLADNAQGLRWLLAPRGEEISRLIGVARAAQGRPLFAIAAPSALGAALRRAHRRELADFAAHAAERAASGRGARQIARKTLVAGGLAGAALLAGLCAVLGPAASSFVAALLGLSFLANIFLRLAACRASFAEAAAAPDLADADLPVYTILVALYLEAPVARQLAKAIDRLNYPRAKLDVKFIVEPDDTETLRALRRHAPRAAHEIVTAPYGAPRTKPRALNAAMPFARGSLVVVFDAEDLPEPDQLRKAAALFAAAPERLGCLQACLSIDNFAQNWMTCLFAVDYAALFLVFNRGLAAVGLPFFLGGSSNHFRVEALREIGFWDAFNVTEDADLGLRLARAGYETRMFRSRTYEEAPANFSALLRQRTRWLKGWMQTAIVHGRDPSRLLRDLGAFRAGAVLATFAGGVLGPLLSPFFAAFFFYQAADGKLLAPETPAELAWSALSCGVPLLGLASLAWPIAVAVKRERLALRWDALFWAPAWAIMLTLAAWRAFRELWLRPFHWEKTGHGLAPRRADALFEAPPGGG